MKAHFMYVIFVAVTSTACSKKAAEIFSTEPNPFKPLKWNVVEAGTGLPLSGVFVRQSDCVKSGSLGCVEFATSGPYANDKLGDLLLPEGYKMNLQTGTLYKDSTYWVQTTDDWVKIGYYNPLSFQPQIIPKRLDSLYHLASYDSLVSYMVPVSFARVRVKNTNPYPSNQYIRLRLLTSLPFKEEDVYWGSASCADTTFLYAVYGNAKHQGTLRLHDSAGRPISIKATVTKQSGRGDTTDFTFLY